jgi:hypothetical protein
LNNLAEKSSYPIRERNPRFKTSDRSGLKLQGRDDKYTKNLGFLLLLWLAGVRKPSLSIPEDLAR